MTCGASSLNVASTSACLRMSGPNFMPGLRLLLVWMHRTPVPRDVDAARHPDAVVLFRRDRETLQARLSRAGLPSSRQCIPTLIILGRSSPSAYSTSKVRRSGTAQNPARWRSLRPTKFHVVGVERVGHDELPFDGAIGHRDRQVERQVIAIVIAVVFKATVLKHGRLVFGLSRPVYQPNGHCPPVSSRMMRVASAIWRRSSLSAMCW